MSAATKLPPTDTGRCGEPAGHARHRQRGQQPCDPCRLAKNAYQRTIQPRPIRPAPNLPELTRVALPLTSGRLACTGRLHDFRPMSMSQCAECFGWRDDPRHPVVGGPVVGR